MKKELCVIYANCQNQTIAHFLQKSPAFNQKYLIRKYSVAAMIENGSRLAPEVIEQAKLFIYQPVKDTHGERASNYLLQELPADCHTVSFPSLYFTGYFPQYCKNPALKTIRPNHPHGVIPHGDANIISLVNQGKSDREISDLLHNRNFYTQEYLLAKVEESLAELARRESELDVRVSDFIRDNYQSHQLFYSQNHPTDILGMFVVNQILELLGFSPIQDPLSLSRSLRGVQSNVQIPFYPSVIEHLHLTFAGRETVYGHNGFCTNRMTFARYISEYIELHKLNDHSPNFYYFQGIKFGQSGKHQLAINALNQAIALKPGNAAYYQELGKIYEKTKNLAEAEAAYKQGIKLSPDWDQLYELLGNVMLEQKKYSAALTIFKKAAIKAPNCDSYYYSLGRTLLKLNRLNDAEKCFHKAIQLEPTKSFYYRYLGDIYKKKGQFDLAKHNYQKAISISPNTAYFYRSLADVLAKQNLLDEAINTCEQATQLNSRNPNFYRTLGDIQLQKGDVTHALKTYQRAIKLKPDQVKQIFAQLEEFIQAKVDSTTANNLSPLAMTEVQST
ncbi:MAG: WcbI family polysaccharide biosynthesis putative acetyltransferase [Cyanobacteria bacterium J06643_13]